MAIVAGSAASVLAPTGASAAAGDPVIAIGGDIACPPGKTVDATHCGQGKTGTVVTAMNPNFVIPLGDSQYDAGTPAEYSGSYNTTGWGSDKSISRPATGNHEYRTTGATGYYGYFGANAGDPQKGYYSWDVPVPGASPWHMIALNSECAVLGGGSITAGCGAGSTQEAWLKADLAAHKNVCTIAYWHRPRFSSSTTTPSSTTYTAFWNDLYAAGADLVLNGHAHDYERFAPQNSAGVADPKGPVELLVGTGGDGFQTMGPGIANSVVRNAANFGAMKLTLHANSYNYQFMPAAGYTLTDSGSGTCHNAPAGDTTKPGAPGTPTATASSANQVNLSWGAASDNVGVTNYNIYRGANGATPTLLTTTTTNATSYTDTTVMASTSYTYQVSAQDAAGNIGPLSAASAAVTTPSSADSTPPTTPTNAAVEDVFYNELDLGWTGSTDSGTGVSGYQVYRKGPGESGFTLLATTTGTGAGHNSYVDTTVKPSSTYQYQVRAVDGAGNLSSFSNTASGTTPAGPTSKTFTFTATDDATIQQANPTATGNTSPLIIDNSPVDDALLKFNVATSGCDTLTSAKLTLTNNADGSTKGGDFYTTGTNWSEGTVNWNSAPTRGALMNSLGAVASNATATVDVTPGVTLNGAAAFRVGSTSSDGVHYFSKEGTGGKPTLTVVCSSATVPDNTAPSAPPNLTASNATPGEIDLAWQAATDNIAVTNYDIYRGGSKVSTVAGDALTYQDTTVAAGTSYTYTVRALDAAGNSSGDSNSASATATSAPVAAPTSLNGSATNSTSVHLTWTASTTGSVTGYNIYRGTPGGMLNKISSTGTGTSFDDVTATAGTAYDYAVTAVATGGAESAKSNIVTVTTPGGADMQAPSAPSGLSATASSSTSVDLRWAASTDNIGVTGYTVYRAPGGSTIFASVGTATGTATTFTDSSATAGTSYDYQVKASDAAGNVSAASNTASVTTPTGGGGGGGGITAGTAKVSQITTAGTSWTVNLPTYAAGDFMVVWLGNNLGSTAGTPASLGWTSQIMTNESSGLKGTFLTRRMVAGDPTSITVTWSGSTLGVAEAVAFTGVNATTPVEVKAGQAEASTTAVATHSTPSVTTTTAGDVLVSGFTTDNASTWTSANTELADAAAGSVSAALYYSAPVAAGSHAQSGTATTASVKAVSSVLALRAG